MARIYDRLVDWIDKPRGLLGFAAAGDTEAVLRLLDRGCDIEQSWQGTTAIMEAASGGHASTVRTLLDRGARINPASRWEWDSFACAVTGGSIEVVQMFLELGADIDARDPEYKVTGLMRAAGAGKPEIVQLLLERGAEINAVDSEDKTALTYAKLARRADVINLIQVSGGIETDGWKE